MIDESLEDVKNIMKDVDPDRLASNDILNCKHIYLTSMTQMARVYAVMITEMGKDTSKIMEYLNARSKYTGESK